MPSKDWHLAIAGMAWLIAMLLGVGCPDHAGQYDDDDTAPGDDDAAGDDDTAADDDDSAEDKPEDIAGTMHLYYARESDGMGGTNAQCSFGADFMDEKTAGEGGVIMESPDGLDDCAITLYAQSDIDDGGDGELTALSAGTITLTTPAGDIEIEPTFVEDDVATYHAELEPDVELVYGASYGVYAEGDEFPGFGKDGLVTMPERIDLDYPPEGTDWNLSGPLTLEWTGGDEGGVWVTITDGTPDDNEAYLVCWVDNDGQFTIDETFIDQLPSDQIRVALNQTAVSFLEVVGEWVQIEASTTIRSIGTNP